LKYLKSGGAWSFLFGAAQLTSDYVVANGVHLPTKRCAYARGPDRRPILEMLMVAIDIRDVSFK